MRRDRRDSVTRLLWRATMPEALPLVGLGVLTVLVGWSAWHDHRLNRLAFEWRTSIWLYGNMLMAFPPIDARRRRLRTYTLLGPTAAEPLATPVLDDPGAIVVAQPIVIGAAAAYLGFALGLSLILSFSHDAQWSEPLSHTIAFCLLIGLSLTVGLVQVTKSTRRLYAWSQDVAASAATAEANADRARITALQAQMNPHFLFNALNTVASLLGTDGDRARRTVQNLSGMLTHTLQRSARPLTTVEEEVQFVRDYLEIERERFGARLQVTYAVDAGTAAMVVPTMSLQPLVENAIKHAVANRIEGGHIRIVAWQRGPGQGVRLVVEDDGPGFAPGSEDGTGLGNLRSRLRSLYGPPPAAELVTETLATGARVSLMIPFGVGGAGPLT